MGQAVTSPGVDEQAQQLPGGDKAYKQAECDQCGGAAAPPCEDRSHASPPKLPTCCRTATLLVGPVGLRVELSAQWDGRFARDGGVMVPDGCTFSWTICHKEVRTRRSKCGDREGVRSRPVGCLHGVPPRVATLAPNTIKVNC